MHDVTFAFIYVNMTDIKTGPNPLFLREEELRQAIEMLFFAYRDFTAEPDQILAQYGFGRLPGCPVRSDRASRPAPPQRARAQRPE